MIMENVMHICEGCSNMIAICTCTDRMDFRGGNLSNKHLRDINRKLRMYNNNARRKAGFDTNNSKVRRKAGYDRYRF